MIYKGYNMVETKLHVCSVVAAHLSRGRTVCQPTPVLGHGADTDPPGMPACGHTTEVTR